MLILTLNIGKERYGIEAGKVIEVIPWIELQHVPRVDECIAGIFNYRGTPTPVIDICRFFEQQPCEHKLSSRIIIINTQSLNGNKYIGLIAENVTEVIKCDKDQFTDTGIDAENARFLGKIYQHNKQLIQIIRTDQLIPESVARQLALVKHAGSESRL